MSLFNTLVDASGAIEVGETAAVDLLADTIEAIELWEPSVRALLETDLERARVRAEALDRESLAGYRRGPMHGIPIVIKDLIDVEGIHTTAGSRILAGNVAARSAAVVERLINAGAVIVAKSNTHEFGYGALTPPTRNPWDTSRMPGGSSGGSAAAVGARMVLGSLGTDNAGSIREPAALCGVSGFKPTNGFLSSDGVYQLTWTMGSVGPIAVSVADCAVMFEVMAGEDAEAHATAQLGAGNPDRIAGLRIGVPRELLKPSMPYVAQLMENISIELTNAGATVDECSVGNLDELVSVGFLTLGSEALAIHSNWLRERADEYTEPVRHYLQLAEAYTAVDYLNAQRLRFQAIQRIDSILKTFDVLLTPAQLVTAPPITDTVVEFPDGTSLPRDLTLVRPLIPFSLTGHPALTVPVGLEGGLPLALQVVGGAWDDRRLLRIGSDIQALSGWEFPAASARA